MDFLIGFVSGIMFTWQGLIGLFFLGVLLEYSEHYVLATFTAIAAAGIAYLMFTVPLVTIGIAAIGYLVIGLLWSFWRFKRWIDEQVERRAVNGEAEFTNYEWRQLHPKNQTSLIVSWVILWPFSLVANVCGDLIRGIESLVNSIFKSVYTAIFDKATKNVKITREF